MPFGTTVNASHGTVRVTIATTTPGTTATALFYTGEFAITQNANGTGLLALDGPLQSCSNAAAREGGPPTAGDSYVGRRPAKPPKTRSLWGNGGSGQFTTKGNYAAATVLGTVWLTTDSCSSTVVSVAEGAVSVSDLVTNGSSNVTTGQALTVQSSGAMSVAPYSIPGIAISASSQTVTLGQAYSATATGTAGGSGSAYLYQNDSVPCGTTLSAEKDIPRASNHVTYLDSSKTLSAPGPFTLSAHLTARAAGTKYFCAYLTNPVAFAQVIIKISG